MFPEAWKKQTAEEWLSIDFDISDAHVLEVIVEDFQPSKARKNGRQGVARWDTLLTRRWILAMAKKLPTWKINFIRWMTMARQDASRPYWHHRSQIWVYH
jgi:hypothetical protein